MSASASTVRLYAAGSLTAAMADITREFEKQASGVAKVETVLGASGLLGERIAKGEAAHVFASADTGHPKRRGDQGRTAGTPGVFARNELCALVRGGLAVTTDTLLDRMLDPAITMRSRCSGRLMRSRPVPRPRLRRTASRSREGPPRKGRRERATSTAG